eukprot:XP_001706979.1 Hypothetical protein GL50803_39347 [Giardia lamblia ATCC 50803]
MCLALLSKLLCSPGNFIVFGCLGFDDFIVHVSNLLIEFCDRLILL